MGNHLLIQIAPITLSLERFAQLLQENRILGYPALCVSLYVFYWICLSFYRLTFHPLAKYPGPWLAAVSPLFYCWVFARGRAGPEIKAAHDKYGPVVRIAPNDLSFATPTSYRDIYTKQNGRGTFIKTEFYKQISMGFETVGFASEDRVDVHAKQRKLFAPVFSAQGVRAYEHLLLSTMEKFLKQIERIGKTDEGVDIAEWFHRLLYDVTADLAFGEPSGATDTSGDNYWLKLVNDNINIATYVDCACRFAVFKFLIENFTPKRALEARDRHVKWSIATTGQRILDPRREGRPDMLTYLLENKNAEGVTLDEMTSHLSQIILAGGGTTAIVLGAMIYFLILNPEMLQRVRDETIHLFNNSDEIKAPALAKCEFLTAVIKEGLRMMPPAPTGLPRYSPGETVDGHYVPKGTQVFVHPWTLTRSEKYWKNAWTFNPERWMDPNSTDVKEAAMPFLLGPRQCIGQNLAWDQMRVIITKIFYLFDLELVRDIKDWPSECGTFLTWSTTPLNVRVKPREGALSDPFFARPPAKDE
ncbi:cytochrome P450 [Pyronema domesticum]|uniref:Similar to Probable sterigmatocystin biosynthesis P450 monooxygenase stcF acc. no. Q12609 n=1 Tax=Pyronema omphalodes (strain CBS 100304) TaxID=1076935 RepID=U4LJP9_PYROM|nr:cytochrome P450 [Pyronema domesticum]CCX32289.1 Similar to Probable sterigmatocystin biosynthesis P450 monooxygenase stcF; acc. no. Q12609 [Pyronema omphalodes CBS 100304]